MVTPPSSAGLLPPTQTPAFLSPSLGGGALFAPILYEGRNEMTRRPALRPLRVALQDDRAQPRSALGESSITRGRTLDAVLRVARALILGSRRLIPTCCANHTQCDSPLGFHRISFFGAWSLTSRRARLCDPCRCLRGALSQASPQAAPARGGEDAKTVGSSCGPHDGVRGRDRRNRRSRARSRRRRTGLLTRGRVRCRLPAKRSRAIPGSFDDDYLRLTVKASAYPPSEPGRVKRKLSSFA